MIDSSFCQSFTGPNGDLFILCAANTGVLNVIPTPSGNKNFVSNFRSTFALSVNGQVCQESSNTAHFHELSHQGTTWVDTVHNSGVQFSCGTPPAPNQTCDADQQVQYTASAGFVVNHFSFVCTPV